MKRRRQKKNLSIYIYIYIYITDASEMNRSTISRFHARTNKSAAQRRLHFTNSMSPVSIDAITMVYAWVPRFFRFYFTEFLPSVIPAVPGFHLTPARFMAFHLDFTVFFCCCCCCCCCCCYGLRSVNSDVLFI